MTISLTSYGVQERVDALKNLCKDVSLFLAFVESEHDELENFFVNLNEHNLHLTRDAGYAKKIIESRHSSDLITESLSQLTDATLKYLGFVTIGDDVEWNQWLATMSENISHLSSIYEEVSSLIDTQENGR